MRRVRGARRWVCYFRPAAAAVGNQTQADIKHLARVPTEAAPPHSPIAHYSPLCVDAWHRLDAAPVVRGRLHAAGHKAQQVAGQRVLAADDPALEACRGGTQGGAGGGFVKLQGMPEVATSM